ncbi:hypothetical protein [Rhizobium leguminosarum]|nr:hypothetical protein [Rhizobium leguminosarum]
MASLEAYLVVHSGGPEGVAFSFPQAAMAETAHADDRDLLAGAFQ